MKDNNNVKDFLRAEAEKLTKDVEKIEAKMSNLMSKQGICCINKLNQLDRERDIIKGQIFKLYELIGRLG